MKTYTFLDWDGTEYKLTRDEIHNALVVNKEHPVFSLSFRNKWLQRKEGWLSYTVMYVSSQFTKIHGWLNVIK